MCDEDLDESRFGRQRDGDLYNNRWVNSKGGQKRGLPNKSRYAEARSVGGSELVRSMAERMYALTYSQGNDEERGKLKDSHTTAAHRPTREAVMRWDLAVQASERRGPSRGKRKKRSQARH